MRGYEFAFGAINDKIAVHFNQDITMGSDFYWFDAEQKNIIIIIPQPVLDWESFHRTKVEIDDMIMSVNHPVYFIVNFINPSQLPMAQRPALMVFSDAFSSTPANLEGIYIVGAPPIIRIIYNTLRRVSRNYLLSNLTMVKSVEDALNLIDLIDQNSDKPANGEADV